MSRGKSLQDNPRKGKTYDEIYGERAEDIRKKLSKASRGKKPNLGREWTAEQKQNMSRGHIGHPVSAETRAKISRANKGRKRTSEFCQLMKQINNGKVPWNKGKGKKNSCFYCGKSIPAHRVFCSRQCYLLGARKFMKTVKISRLCGPRNPSWKGGVTPKHIIARTSTRYGRWRAKVFRRDNYTCAKTGKKGGNIVAHHIKNFSSHRPLRYDVNNGITLSAEAHRQFHQQYGWSNNTREQLKEFLCDIIDV